LKHSEDENTLKLLRKRTWIS